MYLKAVIPIRPCLSYGSCTLRTMVRALDFAHRWSAEHVARGRLKCLWGVRVAQGAQLVHKPQRAERPLKTEALVFAFVYHRWLRCHSSGWCTSTRHGSQSTISAATRSPPLGAHAIALARSPHQLPALVAWLSCWRIPLIRSFPISHRFLSTVRRYSWWNFLPKLLFEEFSKAANFYFLVRAPHAHSPKPSCHCKRDSSGRRNCCVRYACLDWRCVQVGARASMGEAEMKKRASAESLVRWPPHPNTTASR